MTIKAVILAAGEGRRLRPLTLNKPKCLVSIAGKPLLAHWLDKCQAGGISEVFINGYYLAEQVSAFLKEIKDKYTMKINFRMEKKLSGTGGFIRQIYTEVKNDDFFFFCHGDNFTNLDINDFICFHKIRQAQLSMAMFETDNPSQCGIVEVISTDGLIKVFKEKPEHSISNLASAAIFLMAPSVIESFPPHESIDFSREVLPAWQGKMYGYKINGYNIDIGSPENLEKANRIIQERSL
jgi:mannose-1-phosphate guanylyltransferase